MPASQSPFKSRSPLKELRPEVESPFKLSPTKLTPMKVLKNDFLSEDGNEVIPKLNKRQEDDDEMQVDDNAHVAPKKTKKTTILEPLTPSKAPLWIRWKFKRAQEYKDQYDKALMDHERALQMMGDDLGLGGPSPAGEAASSSLIVASPAPLPAAQRTPGSSVPSNTSEEYGMAGDPKD
ncbi:unnamed protein product, partial [Amoebophrya sp. A25]|eukprot:GSA25T00026870001.1